MFFFNLKSTKTNQYHLITSLKENYAFHGPYYKNSADSGVSALLSTIWKYLIV